MFIIIENYCNFNVNNDSFVFEQRYNEKTRKLKCVCENTHGNGSQRLLFNDSSTHYFYFRLLCNNTTNFVTLLLYVVSK